MSRPLVLEDPRSTASSLVLQSVALAVVVLGGLWSRRVARNGSLRGHPSVRPALWIGWSASLCS